MNNTCKDEIVFKNFSVKKIADITTEGWINNTKVIHAVVDSLNIGFSRSEGEIYLSDSDVTVALESLEEHLISILIVVKKEKKKYLGALLNAKYVLVSKGKCR